MALRLDTQITNILMYLSQRDRTSSVLRNDVQLLSDEETVLRISGCLTVVMNSTVGLQYCVNYNTIFVLSSNKYESPFNNR
mmetsp:Transcript_16158/g.39744  ORF Transcript_16158/g.39744 Transcript_16158/m.39744 type:complete len:81 (+) Transcript_16158:36-278(+)